VQIVPPEPSIVPEPTGVHRLQATIELLEYCPTLQAVHVVAPVCCRVSVTDPGAHGWQLQAETGNT
jgi:hypothetical protein